MEPGLVVAMLIGVGSAFALGVFLGRGGQRNDLGKVKEVERIGGNWLIPGAILDEMCAGTFLPDFFVAKYEEVVDVLHEDPYSLHMRSEDWRHLRNNWHILGEYARSLNE